MKTFVAILSLIAIQGCEVCPAADKWKALSMLESGNCDNVTGPSQEISRYQILPDVWRAETSLPFSSALNPFTARNVAKSIMEKRVRHFLYAHNRQPTAGEWALLFHCPAHVLKPSAQELDYRKRFLALLAERQVQQRCVERKINVRSP